MSNQTISEGQRNGSLWWWQPDADSPLLEALKRTRLDGLKEALKPNIHIINRIFWTCVFLLCANWGGYLTIDAVKDLLQHSVRYDTYEPTSVKDTPWASAIFCPQFMISTSKIKEAKKLQQLLEQGDGRIVTYKNVSWSTTDVQILYTFIHLSCDAGDSFFRKVGVDLEEFFPDLHDGGFGPVEIFDNPYDEAIKDKVLPFLKEGLVHCDEIVKACSWNGEDIVDCSSILKPVQTDVGTCCGFNSIPDDILKKKPSLRSLLNGKKIKSDKEYIQWINYTIDKDPHLFPSPNQVDRSSDVPKRQKFSGPEHGLSLVLGINNNAEQSMCPISDGSGVLMAVVDPLDEPQMLKSGFYVKPNHETLVKIRSKFIKASQGMRAMDKDARKCYLGSENTLLQYAKYTEYNCQLECQANVIEKMCKCIPIDLSYGNNNSIICGTEKKECIRKAKLHLASEGFEKLDLEVCKIKKCYKSCNRIEYKETLSSSVIPKEMIDEAKKHLKISSEMDLFVIHAFQAEDSTPTEVGKEAYSFIQIIGDVFGILGFTIGMTIITPFLILYALGYYIIAKLRMHLWFQNCYNPAFIPPNQRANEPVTEVESVVDGDNQSENSNEGENQDTSAITSASDNRSEDGSGSTESNPNSDDQEGTRAVGELEDADSGVPSSDGQNEDKNENEGKEVVSEDESESSDENVSKDQKDDESKEPDSIVPFSDNHNENEEADDKSIDEVALDGDQIEGREEDIISISPDSDDHKETPAEDENAVVPFVPEDNAQSDNDAERDPKYTTWADIQKQDGYVERKFKHVTLDLSPESQRRLQLFIKTSSDSCSILVGPNPKSPTPKRSPPSSPSHSSPKQEESSLVTSPSPADSKDEKLVTDDNTKIRQIIVMPKNDPNPTLEENDQSPTNNPSSEIKTLASKPEEIPGPSFHMSRLGPKMNRPSNSFSRHVTKDDIELKEVVVEPRYKRPATAPSSFEVRVPSPNSQVQPLPDVEEVEDDGPWTAECVLKLWKS